MTLSEEPGTVDNSTFSKFFAIYSRDENYNLLCVENKGGFQINNSWAKITEKMKKLELENESNMKEYGFTQEELEPNTLPNDFDGNLKTIEYKKDGEDFVRGVILRDYDLKSGTHLSKFHDWFAKLIVQDTRIERSVLPSSMDPGHKVANLVADFFADHLKNTTTHDQWEQGGRDYFIERVLYFTSRKAKIECVLPAFPCKSSNTEKVVGAFPDKGEELALRRLIYLSKAIQTIYEPGMKIFIVSDGHVFSDCIGVDDDVVDRYTERLRYFYSKIIEDDKSNEDYVDFVSLKDLFFKKDYEFDESLIADVQLPHYTGSKICEDSELSRRLLIAGCDTDAGKLRKDIEEADHPRLHLYRGFSRFMLEDLALHPYCKTLSRKTFKKIVSKVAFEMIKRNDAYSNLVELLFPFHMRFSIHAHTNSGPKFGIKLISPDDCKIIKALDSTAEPSFEDLLHIPTPWHNSIIKVEGHRYFYLAKSKIVMDAESKGLYNGEWRKGDVESGLGGYWYLTKKDDA